MKKIFMVNDAREGYIVYNKNISEKSLTQTFSAGVERLEVYAVIGDYGKEQIRVSDRHKYIGIFFYEGRVSFPKLEKEMSDLSSAKIRFSELTLKINNIDGKYSDFITNGSKYRPFIGENVSLYLGRGDEADSFYEAFKGVVHNEGGFSYDRDYIEFKVRDTFERINVTLPLPTITSSVFPNAPEDSIGQMVPFVVGDFNSGFDIINGGINSTNVWVGGQRLEMNCYVKTLAETFSGGLLGYPVGGSRFIFSIGGNYEGRNYYPTTINNCLLWRGQYLYELYFSDSPLNSGGYWGVEIYGLVHEGDYAVMPYIYEKGDKILLSSSISPRGKTFFDPAYDKNPITILKECLVTLGRLDRVADFDSQKLIDMAASSAFNDISCRVSVYDNQINVLEYALSIARQLRLDLYSNKENKLALKHFHPAMFPQINEMRLIEGVHIIESTFKPEQNPRDFFTSAQATYAYSVFASGNAFKTPFYYNETAEQVTKKRVDKQIDFPNLYVEQEVLDNLFEYIRFFSAAAEIIKMTVTWVGLSFELGDFVRINFNVGGIKYNDIPCQIRKISINPEAFTVDLELLSFVNFVFPSYEPSYPDLHLSSWNKVLSLR